VARHAVPVRARDAAAAIRASRGTNRLFVVGTASAARAQYLTGRLTALQHSPWAGELIVCRPG